MNKTQLVGLSFCMTFTIIFSLCLYKEYPLIFYPIDYGTLELIKFATLLLFFSFALVFINFPVLSIIRKKYFSNNSKRAFFIIGTLIVLQLVIISFGYIESSFFTKNGKFFYYYMGVGNSLIYAFAGNIVAFIIAFLYKEEKINSIVISN